MTRRGSIVALASVAGAMAQKLTFNQGPLSIELYLQDAVGPPPSGVFGYKELTVHYQGRSVTLSAKEIMDALEEKP